MKSRGRRCAIPALMAGILFALPPALQAGTITFTGTSVDQNGTGFGNTLHMPGLHPKGSKTTETGSVTWNGSKDVRTGHAANQAQTRTVSELQGAGIGGTQSFLIFHLVYPGSHGHR